MDLAVEPAGIGAAPYLWIEGDDSDDNDTGIKLARVRFGNGKVVTYSSALDWTPTISSFAKLPRPSIDPLNDRLIVRYATQEPAERIWRLVVFTMADARAKRLGDSYRLAERAIPNNDELELTAADLFQGFTACGQYAYLYFGGAGRPSWIVTIDLNDSGESFVDKTQTNAGASLPGREAQGTAIWMVSGAPRLAFGYSAKILGTPDRFEASVFYKSEMV